MKARANDFLGHAAPAAARSLALLWPALCRLPATTLLFSMGFVAGAVFWHFVGFWGFFATIVLKGPDPVVARTHDSEITTGSIGPLPAMHRRTVAAGVDTKCTALELDRASGRTKPTLCTPRDVRWVRSERQGKGDRLAEAESGKGWSVRAVP